MTGKNLAAHRRNARKSRGAATPGGKEQVRDANLLHGFYSQDRDTALRALGENPDEFEAVVEAVREQWQPANRFQELLVLRMARAIWRLNRSDRTQEGYALRQAKDVNNSREDRLHAQMMRLKMTAASLQSLAQAVARERARQLLENILTRQVEHCEALRVANLRECLAGPSTFERAAEIAPTHPDARLMRRMQDSNFREVRRVTNLLLKIKRHQRRMEALAG